MLGVAPVPAELLTEAALVVEVVRDPVLAPLRPGKVAGRRVGPAQGGRENGPGTSPVVGVARVPSYPPVEVQFGHDAPERLGESGLVRGNHMKGLAKPQQGGVDLLVTV